MPFEIFFKLSVVASLSLTTSAVTIQSSVLLGNVTSTNTENIRDLGFSGVIGDVALNSYGDTLICGDGSAKDRYYQTPPCNLLHANSAAYSDPDPRNVTDFNLDANGNAQIFCGYSEAELAAAPESSYGMGITNVIAQSGSTTQGILYFLKNFRPNGQDHIVGGGAAIVDVTGSYPTCNRTSDHWWDCTKEPQYGDHSQVLADDGYIYVYGGANATIFYDGVYLTRVPHDSQQDFSQYEYWNGTQFTMDRIYYPNETQAVLGNGATQGMITWNSYLQSYLYVYTYGAEVRGKTSPKPEGPWGSMDEYFSMFNATEFAFCYSPSQQTRYDTSGKTLVISYTGYPNIIQAIKVEFERSHERSFDNESLSFYAHLLSTERDKFHS
ncbi:uncharacterized protein LY89DRAFT_727654 [Mollisia scopiformis]|uniref:DUF4185 domain-containing protein n=1 Tax=Mollisia scopiformis TaxID=149040 RepID=A0A194XXS9_MOLSC|nr:uncharacterized protein LY89DRAFT_727654 [Mollisia scopiformis]KUJ24637.1 hypothetical protein LY89DRAFT_727654 [Mollisia scopiformis]